MCDNCGCHERAEGENWCENCLDTYCYECGQEFDGCECDDEDDDSLDDESISNTFRPMNAFARAQWLKARGEL